MKKVKIYFLLICLMVGFTACSTPQPSPKNHTHPKILRYALAQEPNTLDPQKVDASPEATIAYHIYEGLMRSYGDQLLYGIANSYEISTDGLVYTFYLRDACYSDGTPVRAQDFVYAIQRMLTEEDSSRPFMAYPIKNAAKIHRKELSIDALGVQATNDKILKFVLENPTPYFLQLLTLPTFSPIPAQSDPAMVDITLSNGPFMLKEWNHNDSIVLEKNPNYWDADNIPLDQVSIIISTNGTKLLDMFFNGELDVLPTSTTNVPESFSPYIQYYYNGANDFIRLNMDGSCPLSNKNLRLALNYAVDKDEIANDLLDGNGIAAKGMFNASVVPYVTDENSPGYAYDPNKARELLKEAGYEDTNGDGYVDKNGQNLSFKLLLQNTEYPDFKPVCEFLKEQYKEVGIQIDLNLMEQNAYYDEIWTGKNYDLVIYRTYADAWNPHGFLMDMYTSKDGTLPAAWNDETLQSMIDNVLMTTDETERQKQYDDLFTYIQEQAISVPLYYQKSTFGYNKKLKNVSPASTTYQVAKFNEMDIEE